jgi:hypothetical protein
MCIKLVLILIQPKGVKLKMRESKLRSGVSWQEGVKAKKHKTRAGCTTNVKWKLQMKTFLIM